jgi:hypothetical protein
MNRMTHATGFFGRVLDAMLDARIPFVVGGSYAHCRHVGIERDIKDLDLMIMERAWPAVERTLGARDITTDLTFPHWLGKALHDGLQVDVIFNGGNGLTAVDRDWFKYAVPDRILGRAVKLAPVEELLWSKSFVMERERFDGADVLHLLRAFADRLDWDRLCRRFAGHEGVLRAHLMLFNYVYPGETHRVPDWVDRALSDAMLADCAPAALCRGTRLSRAQYLVDVEDWGYIDARLAPFGDMTETNWLTWTNAIDPDGSRIKAKVRTSPPRNAAVGYALAHEAEFLPHGSATGCPPHEKLAR